MATPGTTNFYLHLKDKTLKLEDRLKLLRYTWKSKDVFLPNKEQVLVDILTGLLINKKKEQLKEADVENVWQCLHDVLQTKKASEPNRILLRQSTTQMLTDSLLAVDERCGIISPLIGCFLAVMKSDSLSTVFTVKLDTMISVLNGLCGVLALDLCRNEVKLASLVQHTVDRFINALKTAPGQNQILQKLCDVFLPKFIPLWSSKPPDTVQTLSAAVQAVLGHKDHHQSYDVYLKAKHSKSGGHVHKKAKSVEHLFATFSKLLQTNQEHCSMYLPVVYENLMKNNCHNGIHLTAHYLMLELCSLIGLDKTKNILSGPMETSVVLRTVHQLLKIIQGRELYDQGLDEKNESVQFKFYRHIVQVLIGCKQSHDEDESEMCYADWYSCLTVLLQLNHHTVEPRLLEIFTVGWIETEVKGEDIEALDDLLYELVTVYSKLRQVPKLITKLLGTLCVCSQSTAIQLTPRFLKCYGEVTQSLPQGIMLDVWKKFAASLKAHFIDPATKQDTGHFQGICVLFHHFLLNIKVADYTVTDLTLKSVQELLVVMETEILAPLLIEAAEEKELSKLKHTLFLSHALGEVVAMLALYTKYRASEFQTKMLVSHPSDLSYVHGYLERKQWTKLHKRVVKHGDPSLLFVWDMLIVQKIRTVLLFRDVSDWSAVADTMATTLTFLEDADVTEVNSDWSGKLDDITDNNLVTARWYLLRTNMTAIYCVLSEEQLKTVADFLVRCIVKLKVTGFSKEFSLQGISSEFLKSTVMQESGSLLSHVVTSVWSQCGLLFSNRNQKSSPKKKKYDSATANFLTLISVIGQSDKSWSQKKTSESVEKLQEASKALTAMWNSEDTLHVGDIKMLHNCVKIVQCLPLEHLWSCDQIRCLIGLLAVKCLTHKLEGQSEIETAEQLLSDCIALCTCILESSGTVSVFHVIDAATFLDICRKLLRSFTPTVPDYYRCLVFTEKTCHAVLRDNSSLEKLLSYTDKLCLKMEKSQESEVLTLTLCLLQEVCKLLNMPHLKEKLQETCKKMLNSMAKTVLKLSPLLKSSSRSHVEAVLVRMFASVLTAVDKDEDIKKEFLDNFTNMLIWCENILKHVEETEVYTVLSALIFLHTVSKHHVVLKISLGTEDKLRIWTSLVTVLRKLLDSQSGGSGNQSHSDLENQSRRVENQSVEKTADSIAADTGAKSGKKKRKSASDSLNLKQSCDSDPCANDMKDSVSSQMIKMNKLLLGSAGATNLTQNKLDSVSCRISATKIQASEIEETALNPTMINSMYTTLMFDGHLETKRSKVIKMQIQGVMAALLVTFDLDQFKSILQELVDGVHTSVLFTDRGKIQSSLYTWRHLLKLEFSDEQNAVIRYSTRDMMLNFQCIVQQLEHVVADDLVAEVTVPILHAQQQMLASGPKFLASRSSILCLYSCLYTPLGGSTYFPAFSAVYKVLDTFLVHHPDVVFQNIPAFISCAKRLLLSVVEQSNQDLIAQQPDVIKQLMACAYEMERLFSLISTHKVEFGKVAMYVVSDYVTAVQKVTLLPAVKRALVPAVHKMLDLCDKHAISQLHVILSHGVTEVFRLLYQEYKKFHKYQGKI